MDSILTAGDMVFTYERMGNIAEYHQGGETTDHPAGWTSARTSFGSQHWVRSEAVDERTWKVVLHEPDAAWVANQNAERLNGGGDLLQGLRGARGRRGDGPGSRWGRAPTASSATAKTRTS